MSMDKQRILRIYVKLEILQIFFNMKKWSQKVIKQHKFNCILITVVIIAPHGYQKQESKSDGIGCDTLFFRQMRVSESNT